MKRNITIAWSLAILVLVVGGVFFLNSTSKNPVESNHLTDNTDAPNSTTSNAIPLVKKIDCAGQMMQFQNRVLAQVKTTNANSTVYDFFIAYSPERNTCVGGYTTYLNYKFTNTGANLYEFHIEDALTGAGIDVFSGYGQDSQKQWQDYKTELSALTNGEISAPPKN